MRAPFLLTIGSALALFAIVSSASAQTLLLRYNFDEASSGNTDALDLGASPAAPGVFTGTAVTRTANTPGGISVGALNLTSTTSPDYVTAGDVDKLDGLSQLTLTAWVNLQGNPANGNRIMAKQNGSGNFDGFSFAFNNPTSGTISATNYQLNLALGGTGGFVLSTSGANLNSLNQWIFVAVSYDGTLSANNVKFYSGGVSGAVNQLGTTKTANVGSLVANSNEYRVGASSSSTTSPPDFMDDVRVYSGVLDQAALDVIRQENLTIVPEPSTYALIGSGLLTAWALRRKKQ